MKNILLVSIFLLFGSHVFAQSQANDWSAVESLRSRTNVILEIAGGGTIKGKVVSVNLTAINLTQKGRSVAINRNDVQRVYLTRRKSVLSRTLLGAAAGAGIGFGIGGLVAVATKGNGLAAAAGFLYGIPAGAVIGALTTGRKRGELIYYSQ